MKKVEPMSKDNVSLSPWEMGISGPANGAMLITLSGMWRSEDRLPSIGAVMPHIVSGASVGRVTFDTEDVTSWDSGLLTLLRKLMDECAQHQIVVDRNGLQEGVRHLLDLAAAVPERVGAKRSIAHVPFLARLGESTLAVVHESKELIGFVGEATLTFVAFLRGRTRFRRSDLVLLIQEVGAEALPIVTLISFLVGMILAFVGAVQLQQFGAQIFVANLVGLAMAREMGAMMTGIIMSGRTGAAFAAQLGTMRVNQEIDALTTLGISPMEFLVLPRMFALALMMPLLCLYADVMGILGGVVVAVGMLDLSVTAYFYQTKDALGTIDFAVGLFKSAVFGVLVAIAGCFRGMQCGTSASAVGLATTSAVVMGIVLIVVSDAVMTIITTILGI